MQAVKEEVTELAQMKEKLQEAFDKSLEQIESETIKISEHEQILNDQIVKCEA